MPLQVCYTSNDHMQLRVHAEVVDPETGKQETTNTFHFTFGTRDKNVSVSTVVPMTYADGMLYLSGKRHYEESMQHHQC
uniref:SHSP domain-containing protein n=1 Tax=Plectus sambesii TaxID=2011161 RepID=A0A914VKD6_9BILA